jgi:hypothetical protein
VQNDFVWPSVSQVSNIVGGTMSMGGGIVTFPVNPGLGSYMFANGADQYWAGVTHSDTTYIQRFAEAAATTVGAPAVAGDLVYFGTNLTAPAYAAFTKPTNTWKLFNYINSDFPRWVSNTPLNYVATPQQVINGTYQLTNGISIYNSPLNPLDSAYQNPLPTTP